MALVYLSLAFVVGIYFGSQYLPPLDIALPIITAALIIAFLWRKNRPLLLGGLCIALFLCGALRYGGVPTDDDLQAYIGEGEVAVTAVVAEEPEPKDSATRLILSAREIDGEEVEGTLLVYNTRYPTYEYGDLLQLTGELEEPPELDDFDYRAYLERQGIFSIMYYPEAELIESAQGPQPLQAIYSFRHRMGEALGASLAEPQGSLAQGILLGLRHNIPSSLYDDFRDSGTAHLLAISGLHMAIVAGMVLSIAVWLFGRRRPTYFIMTLTVLWSYAVLAGMSPSVMRAAIMVSIFLFGSYVGRQRSGLTAIAFAAAIMVALDPQILWSVSFQLSFAAVLGLIFLTPTFQQWGRRIALPNIMADSFAYSMGAILATLPLIAYYFGYVSLVGLPATFLAVLALPAVIVLSAVVGLIGLISLPVAQVIGWVDWIFLKYMVLVVQGFAALDYSYLKVDRFEAYLVWLYYGVFGAAIWLGGRVKRLFPSISGVKGGLGRTYGGLSSRSRNPFVRWVIIPLLVIAVLVWVGVAVAPENGRLSVSFLDVGQGDATLITTPSGQHILVDGGPSPEEVCLELGEALPFWERTIDVVVLTHAHDDHVTGLVEVLRRYEVKQVLYPQGIDYTSNAYEEWLSVIEEQGITAVRAQAGQAIDLGGGAVLEVLHPPAQFLKDTDSDVDNNGVVLRIAMGEVSFLLAADLYWDGELYLVCERVGVTGSVLKVGHHGSATSTSSIFLDAVTPQVAVISVGADNPFGHPSDEVMARLNESVGGSIYRTDERGTITFTTDGHRLWVEAER